MEDDNFAPFILDPHQKHRLPASPPSYDNCSWISVFCLHYCNHVRWSHLSFVVCCMILFRLFVSLELIIILYIYLYNYLI